MYTLVLFIGIAFLISYIDIKSSIIPDKIMIPAIAFMIILKYFDNSLSINDLIAISIVFIIFVIPIALNMAFGGGDIRFGVFCALFLGLAQIGYFVIFAGLVHLAVLFILKRQSFGFAPAMSLATLLAYGIGNL